MAWSIDVEFAGDKAGDWRKWYKVNIPVADDRFDDHIERLKDGEQ